MKKLNAKLAIQSSDRITIYNIGDRIEFYYNSSNRREEAPCFYEIPFSLSVKKLTSVVTTLFRELEHSLTNAKTVAARQEVICYER